MRKIKVSLKKRSYEIIVGENILSAAGKFIKRLEIGTDAFIITNSYIKNKYAQELNKGLKKYNVSVEYRLVPDSEESKSLATFSSVINDLAQFDYGKKPFIIAFGGGVIGDLSGFISSVYKRGIPYVQIPTTLLAQVDSSIGGKTALDLGVAKNLVGSIFQPRLVISDVALLSTLEKRQVSAGLAEIIKYGLIRDAGLFSFLEKNSKELNTVKPRVYEHLVTSCSKIKAQVVSSDEREERGIRTILNFGHTIGHAIEAAGGYRHYNHGEGVALGMLVASDLSRTMGLLDNNAHQRVEKLIAQAGLPTRIKGVKLKDIINAHYRDKKFIGAVNRFVLLEGIGKTKIVANVPFNIIEFCVRARLAC